MNRNTSTFQDHQIRMAQQLRDRASDETEIEWSDRMGELIDIIEQLDGELTASLDLSARLSQELQSCTDNATE